MTERLFPRLPIAAAHERYAVLRSVFRPPEREDDDRVGPDWEDRLRELRAESSTAHPMARFAGTGGTPVSEVALSQIVDDVRRIAGDCGYPERAGSEARRKFDLDISLYIYEEMEMQLGEALRNETWSFFGAVMFPDLVAWRFPTFTSERVIGGEVRNTFQRLWARRFIFDPPDVTGEARWLSFSAMDEDSFEAVLGRGGRIGSNPRICIALGYGLARARQRFSESDAGMPAIMRATMRLLRYKLEVRALDVLDDGELGQEIDICFDQGHSAALRERETA